MPAPWLPLTLAQFRDRVAAFPWSRQIAAVHMHHTWSPTKAEWNGRASVQAMRDYHVNVNKWSDIAQHVTIAPDGLIWTGRDWNRAPASSTGYNGDSRRGPFMFETVGNFDVGHETLDGAQKAAVLGVIAAVQERFNLPPDSLRFHRQLGSPKTCPGSGIDYATTLAEVTAYRLALHHAGTCP